MRLLVEAATIDESGFRAVGEEGDVPDWSTVDPTEVTLGPGETALATLTVTVPPNAAGGERYGVVFAELPPPAGVGVGVGQRVGFRIYLSIGGEEEPPTDFTLPAFRPVRLPDGRPAVEIDACNTGGRAIDLVGEVELKNGPGGVSAGPFQAEGAPTVAIDSCTTFAVILDPQLPNGPWDATARLRSGEEERTAQARITFPKEAGERGKKVETREVTGTLPGIIATGTSILLLLLLAGWLFWFLLKRRKRKKDDEEEPGG